MGTWTKGFKAFNPGMTCRDKQYAENSEYEEPEAEMCRCGMHFCQDPWDVTDYYDLVDDDGHVPEFAEVEGGDVETDDNKSVTRHLRIGARLSLGGWIKACIGFLFERTDTDDRVQSSDDRYARLASSSDYSRLASSGDISSLASSGYYARLASSGDAARFASSGDYARIASSGDYSKLASSGDSARFASSGDYARIASSGDYSKLASSGDSASLASSGDYARIASSGYHARLASSGYCAKLASSGVHSIVCAIGLGSMAKASVGSWITLAEFDEKGVVKLVKTEQVDGERIKSDTWYVLADGEFKEVRE